MNNLSGKFKLTFIFCFLLIGKAAFAVPSVEAQVIHYTEDPKPGYSFNRVEKLAIVVFSNKLIKKYQSPYTLEYRIIDKEGNLVEGEKKQLLFTMCKEAMIAVKTAGDCREYNNVTVISLKTRQTRRPPSNKGYLKVGRYWVKEQEANLFPRFKEMKYKLESFKLIDKTGKFVQQ